MRRSVTLLLLPFLIAGCSLSKGPAPQEWPFTAALLDGTEGAGCQEPAFKGDLQVGPVTAYGLDFTMPWSPVGFNKVNWRAERGGLTVQIEARRQGELAPIYQGEIPAGPSGVRFPAPGCWETTVRVDGNEQKVLLSIPASRIEHLARVIGDDEVGRPITDKATIRQLLAEMMNGRDLERPEGAPISLGLKWEGGTGHTLFGYYPSGSKGGPAISFHKSFLTAGCADNATVLTKAISPKLAAKLEASLSLEVKGAEGLVLPGQTCSGLSPAGT